MLHIKIILNLLAIGGLLIALGDMLGHFKDDDRVNFVEIIEKKLECSKEHPGAEKFIEDFVYSSPEYEDMNINETEIEKVILVGYWVGNSNNESGRNVESVSSGTIKLKAFDGRVTKPLCSYEDLNDWSKENPFWKWLGWGIVAVSVFLGIVLLIIEERSKKKDIIKN